jgi:hypothetical protein
LESNRRMPRKSENAWKVSEERYWTNEIALDLKTINSVRSKPIRSRPVVNWRNIAISLKMATLANKKRKVTITPALAT